MTKITKAFFDAASPECSVFHKHSKPAVRFEVMNGYEGIAGYYHYPRSMHPSKYEDYVVGLREAKDGASLRQEWDILVALNPELSVVRFDRMSDEQSYYAVMGAACMFNPIDIDFFVNYKAFTGTDMVAHSTRSDPNYARLLKHINAHYDQAQGINWVPAPSTLLEIKRQLESKRVSEPALRRGFRPYSI